MASKSYSVQSLYDVIKDDLKNDKLIKEWIQVTKSVGDLNDFFCQAEGVADELILDGKTLTASGNESLLAATVLIFLKEANLIKAGDAEGVKLAKGIAHLLYKDIKPIYDNPFSF
jgi:hypothetical protein